ncbi:unnamed protein product [Darwinula stevensoni]|uniref:Enhancer of polycomb-like protein n=1 Tax=Darwinula stevensoni TaxID=69355 RepID=A0A7R8X8S6_9CRUS|nr:unnamed protein product [Darwinula stevensoni]CAG0889010.1 unnamed protein product [Darwinula stevensoni]
MTMSKLSFRARALDASKAMLLYFAEELPDLPEASINRAVPQMPTGMEKDEESEHHLQRAISARQKYGETPEAVIPVPEVQECTETYYWLYSDNYRMPRSLIHVQPFSMDQDIPDYDMDMEDEGWFQEHKKKSDVPLSRLQFEEMMDRLEKGSGQQSLSLKEARMLLKEDDDLITAVYEYWLAKRQRTGHPLIPMMKQDKGMSTSAASANPYIAFRKRTEKMQTRKNRKNDESSYEKMLKLRRDLTRSVTLLEMVKRREKLKRENLHLTIEILEKRYQVQDFDGRVLNSVSSQKAVRPVFTPLSSNFVSKKEETTPKQEKRAYKKRKRKESVVGEVQALSSIGELASEGSLEAGPALRGSCSPTLWEDSDVKSPFPFRRKSSSLSYHALGFSYPVAEWCAMRIASR